MRVALIGSNHSSSTPAMVSFASKVGELLMDLGHTLVNGGMGGTMVAAARGARQSPQFEPHRVIGILPVPDSQLGNEHSGVVIATDMGSARNRIIILNAEAVLAIGGGAGTLNEISLAWELGKPVAAYSGAGGWAARLAGQSIDKRRSDHIRKVEKLDDVRSWLVGINPE